jgi:hypothetical protein
VAKLEKQRLVEQLRLKAASPRSRSRKNEDSLDNAERLPKMENQQFVEQNSRRPVGGRRNWKNTILMNNAERLARREPRTPRDDVREGDLQL